MDNSLSVENLYRGFHLLNYKQMCEALKLDPEKEESRIVWQEFQQTDRALRNFYQEELEAIALYFQQQK